MCFGLMTKRGCNVDPMDEPGFSPNTVYRNLLYILMKGEWYIRNGITSQLEKFSLEVRCAQFRREGLSLKQIALERRSVIGIARASAALIWRRPGSRRRLRATISPARPKQKRQHCIFLG